jgi:hypothetical protein
VDGLGASLFGLQGSGLRGAVQWFTKLVDSNRDLITTNVRGFLEQAKPVIAAFADGFKSAWPAIEGAIKSLTSLGGETNWLKTLQELAVTLGKVTAFAIGAAGALGTVLVGSLRLAAAQFDLVVETAESAWGWMIAGIGRVIFAVDDFVMNLGAKWERLKIDAIAGAKALIDGLVNGITSGAQWVVEAAKNLGKSAIDAIKAVLRIRSPSQVFAGIGDQTAKGFELGFERSMVNVNDSMARAVQPPPIPAFGVAPSLLAPRWTDDVQVPMRGVLGGVDGSALARAVPTLPTPGRVSALTTEPSALAAISPNAAPVIAGGWETPVTTFGRAEAALEGGAAVYPSTAASSRGASSAAAPSAAPTVQTMVMLPDGGGAGETALLRKLEEIRRAIVERREAPAPMGAQQQRPVYSPFGNRIKQPSSGSM